MSEYVVSATAAVNALDRKDVIDTRATSGLSTQFAMLFISLTPRLGHVTRRREHAGKISDETARTALRAPPTMIDYR